jgi:hypothetical protein
MVLPVPYIDSNLLREQAGYGEICRFCGYAKHLRKPLPFGRKFCNIASLSIVWANGEIGRRAAFRSQWPQGLGGSSPLSPTRKETKKNQ